MVPPRIDGRGYHDGQVPCDLADQGFGYIDVPLHGLHDIFPVGVVLAVKNADAVRADDIAPLKAVHLDALFDDRAFFLQRHRCVGQLGNAAGIHGDIFVSGQLLFNPLRRQDGSFAHHLFHCDKRASVSGRNAG